MTKSESKDYNYSNQDLIQNTTNKLFEMYDRDIYYYCIVKCTSQSNNNKNLQY